MRKAEALITAYVKLLSEKLDFNLLSQWVDAPSKGTLTNLYKVDKEELICKYLCEKHQVGISGNLKIKYKEVIKLVSIDFSLVESLAEQLNVASSSKQILHWKERYYNASKQAFELSEELEKQLEEECKLYTTSEEENTIYEALQKVSEGMNALANLGLGLCGSPIPPFLCSLSICMK